ncbi:MAG: SH3 domain-containing protein [Acidobacteriota bacterium]|nr:SH3 domain-containing protein [Acidobacteriota bacterium]
MAGQRIFRIFPICFAVFLVILCGCDSKPREEAVIGHAYAGPASLSLHQDIDSKSRTVATVHHGDKLAIVGQRRRWYKVRVVNGVEGWTSDRELLDPDQMKRLKALADETAGMPSQGAATTFSTLNVHTEPSRLSASFIQIKEHEKVDVIAHKVAPRGAAAPKRELAPPRAKIEKKKAPEKSSKAPLRPAPPPPEPPADLLELSKMGVPPPDPTVMPSGPVDDWTLIRTAAGQSGWVLTSALYLAIPDEVAQYAEGHRITSYFSLGKIADADQQKDIWLWTTSDTLGEDHDFDGYRVFVWSPRRHRYETAYIQRRERGFFPVLAKTGEFSVCLERDDGSRVRKQYVMMGNAVRPAGERPCKKGAAQDAEPQVLSTARAATATPAGKSLTDRMKDRVRGLFNR